MVAPLAKPCPARCDLVVEGTRPASGAYDAGTEYAAPLGCELRAATRDLANAEPAATADLSPAARAVDAERTRLRHDLHDGLGPLLSGIGLCARALSELLDDRLLDSERTLLERIRLEACNAATEVRRLVEALSPGAVETLGLVDALRHHTRLVTPATAVEITVSELPALPPDMEDAVYRIVTEALTNVVRHADAPNARVTLGVRRRSLLVGIADDGRGMSGPHTGVGLVSMRRRAEALGGTLMVRSAPGRGTTVTVTFPLGDAA
jgi:signal transduction histidine kinase